ncbi:antibiotic ABC transporter ATP-binding protein [Sulfolobales archaeon HS-7]|nr:antibiotic ABC transporter ATP-binding protein [Sulfolobales archaeon HS-7]
MIEIVNVSKRYGERIALDSVSITMDKPLIYGILGPNGAGKTTLLRVALGLIYPEMGEVRIMGKSPFKEKGIFKEIGYVQELPNLPPFLSGEEVLKLSARLKGIPEFSVNEYLDLVGMSNHAKKKIAKYSKGMVQRIALAEALLGDPKVIVMDEPNIGTDPALNVHIRDVLREKRKSGSLIVMTTHELEEVRKLCNRVFLIFAGRVFYAGDPEDLVARFLGLRVIITSRTPEKVIEVAKGLGFIKSTEIRDGKVIVLMGEDRREEFLKTLIEDNVSVIDYSTDLSLEDAYINALIEASKDVRKNN